MSETQDTHPSGAPWRNFYGRFKGKTLRDSQKRYLEDLGEIALGSVEWDDNPDRQQIDLAYVFGKRPVWLEIGFGGGEHLVHQAVQNPEAGLVGAEPFINGVAMLLGKIRGAGCENVRVHPGDVRALFDVLHDASIAKAFLLYPDPWPKHRHHRRRFVTPEYLEPLHRVLVPGAEFRLATDISDYVRQALVEVPKAGFELIAQSAMAWNDWSRTRYEAKALREGREPHYLTFRR
jgi:tRNA (guanine-N7-)-methyltransferase